MRSALLVSQHSNSKIDLSWIYIVLIVPFEHEHRVYRTSLDFGETCFGQHGSVVSTTTDCCGQPGESR